MKKSGIMMLSLMLALSMSACSSSGAQSKSETTAAETTAEAAGTTAAEAAETTAAGTETTAAEAAETTAAGTETTAAEAAETTEAGAETTAAEAAETTAAGTETTAAGAADTTASYADYVKLNDYLGMEIDVIASEVTDDEVRAEIEGILEEDAVEADVTDGASDGNTMDVSITVKVNGKVEEDLSEPETVMTLGFGEYGEDVDNALMGAKAGDEVTVNVTLDDMYGDEWDGKEAEYTIKVSRVYRDIVPTLTEEYVKEHTDYDSVDDWKAAVKAELEEYNKESQVEEARVNVIDQVIAASEINGYPQELYDSISDSFQEIYTNYAQMYDMESWTDIISEEELDAYVQQEVNYVMVVQEIANRENLNMSEEEYQTYLKEHLEDYGFETVEDLVGYYGDVRMHERAMMDKVGEYLVSKGTIHEMSEEEYDEKYSPAEAAEAVEIEVAPYDPFDYVTLGDYKGVQVDIRKTEVTEEQLNEEIEALRMDESEQEDVTDGAQMDDYLQLSYEVKVDGKEASDLNVEEMEYQIGMEDPSKEFDDALLGAKAGDHLQIKTTLGEDYGEDYNGKEAEYDVNVLRVYRDILPEFTDEFVKEHTEYDTVEAYKEAKMQELIQNDEDYNREEASDLLISKVVENATISGYPQDLHDSVRASMEAMYNSYAAFFGATDWKDLVTEEEMEQATVEEIHTKLVFEAIAKQENIEVNDEELQKYIEQTVKEFEYESTDALLEEYSEAELLEIAVREKITDFLMDNAVFNELTKEEYEAIYGSDFEEVEEEDEEDAEADADVDAEEADEDAEADETEEVVEADAEETENNETTAEETAETAETAEEKEAAEEAPAEASGE